MIRRPLVFALALAMLPASAFAEDLLQTYELARTGDPQLSAAESDRLATKEGAVQARAGGGLATISGTSMATPHVAGVAALWAEKLSVAGQLNAQLLADRLVGSATSKGVRPGTDPSDIGAGVVRAPQD